MVNVAVTGNHADDDDVSAPKDPLQRILGHDVRMVLGEESGRVHLHLQLADVARQIDRDGP